MTPSLRLPDFRFTKTTLANGLDVIARHQGQLPLVAVNLWYHVGSKDEERRQRGFAHLFEHLMFEGSEHFPGDFFEPLQRLGAGINGSTSTDRTNYFEDIPAAHAELVLAMESDRMAHLLPALTDTKLRVQKDVVKNEYRQNYANRPYGMVWRHLAEALYPPSHPYSWQTIGVMEDVEAASRDDVEAFFRRFYVPSNASLAIVGDLDEDRALALAERYFGTIGGGTKALRPFTPDLGLNADILIRMNDAVELERVYLNWHTVAHFHDDDAALLLLSDILTRGRSSRLYRKLVVELELAQDVSAYQSGRELSGTFGVSVTLRPGHQRERVRALIDAELERVAESGVTDEEIARVRNGRLASFFFALDNIGGFGGVADRLNAYNTYLGDPGRITSDFRRYEDVTPEAIREQTKRYLAGRPRVVLEVIGRKAKTTAPPLDRSVPPASAPALPFRAPVPLVQSLRCGLPLWVVPRRDLPIVGISIVLAGGAARQTPDSAGLAQLTTSLMDEGTTSRSAYELALAAERMGTHLSVSCGWDGSYVGLQCLAPHLPASLDLAADVLRNPTFPEQEWERLHGQTVAALRAERDSAEARAYRGLLTALYEPGHPYRLPIDGEEGVVAKLSRADVRRFHDQYHGPSLAACVVAGDVDPDEVARLLDERLAGWSGPEVARTRPPDFTRGKRPRILLLDRPAAAQAAIRCGHVGIARHDPDYTDMLVLNQILGGQFTSRLNKKLREEKGFTYGVRSHFDCRRGSGPFSISASLQTDRLGEALEDLRHEVEALVGERPPTPAELDDARRALIEGQARHFETPSALVARFANLIVNDLPPDDHARFPEQLAGVTSATLGAGARRLILPGSLVIVVTADAGLVLDQLRRLDWAELEVVPE